MDWSKALRNKNIKLEKSSYSNNPKDRCCKQELHKHTTYLSKKLNHKIVLDGVNLDDLRDYVFGIKAAAELFLPCKI